jgi:hypothetical protein
VNRFIAAARASAARRGWDEQDAAHRYHRRLVKFDHAISRANRRARLPQRTTLEHAAKLLRTHHVMPEHLAGDNAGRNRVDSVTKLDRPNDLPLRPRA